MNALRRLCISSRDALPVLAAAHWSDRCESSPCKAAGQGGLMSSENVLPFYNFGHNGGSPWGSGVPGYIGCASCRTYEGWWPSGNWDGDGDYSHDDCQPYGWDFGYCTIANVNYPSNDTTGAIWGVVYAS